MKFNIDGSHLEGKLEGAVPGTRRDGAGCVVAEFAERVRTSSALETEMLALRATHLYLEAKDDMQR